MAGATLCSASLTRHGGGWDVHFHPTPRLGCRSRSINPVREGKQRGGTGAPRFWPAMPDSPVASQFGERVRRRIDAALDTLPGRTTGPERSPVEVGMGVSMPILPDGTPRVQGGGSLRPRLPAPACHDRSSDRDSTAVHPATCGTDGLSAQSAIPCPPTSDVERTPAHGPETPHSGGQDRPAQSRRNRLAVATSSFTSSDGE